jgi:hypothetical protein
MSSESVSVAVMSGAHVELTPEILAKAFWVLGSDGQADFFDALGAVIEEDHKTNAHSYSDGAMQWCGLKWELRQPGRERANNMHMALSAFAFDFWPQKIDGARTDI